MIHGATNKLNTSYDNQMFVIDDINRQQTIAWLKSLETPKPITVPKTLLQIPVFTTKKDLSSSSARPCESGKEISSILSETNIQNTPNDNNDRLFDDDENELTPQNDLSDKNLKDLSKNFESLQLSLLEPYSECSDTTTLNDFDDEKEMLDDVVFYASDFLDNFIESKKLNIICI
ncbi:4811_t:CDS:2 [Ambispora leptoticha]|uniref:4811_t:CDS:1 n=1 Tax=Ambispora leptoticha TaxID=144679 RepID=A0A9N9H0L7_9GLOM|nr:4811_t:CDS:2 [Ambispora leptoticha]